jgi:formylglycine-generating enzyme required for sulfatase activity
VILRAKHGFALAVVAVPLATACALGIDFGGLDDGAPLPGSGDSTDAGPLPDVSLPDAPADGPCPVGQGRPLVPIGTAYCIDSTEVTVDDYIAFLSAKVGDTSGQPPECAAWNTSFTPQGWPQSPGDVPVVGVNWCDAYMYCAWAGKRLCGGPDGGAASSGGWADPAQSEWFKACSRNGDGLHDYPYGNVYDAAACNGVDRDAGKPLPSFATCQGGFPGVFDLSGNVFEWENACNPGGDASDHAIDFCNTRGGSFRTDIAGLRCDDGLQYTRESAPDEVGIRCCSAPRH